MVGMIAGRPDREPHGARACEDRTCRQHSARHVRAGLRGDLWTQGRIERDSNRARVRIDLPPKGSSACGVREELIAPPALSFVGLAKACTDVVRAEPQAVVEGKAVRGAVARAVGEGGGE
jgi:hypothetical protein